MLKASPPKLRCLKTHGPKSAHSELSNFYKNIELYIQCEPFALVMTNERTKEFLNSDALSVLHNINTDLKLRSRTEVSKQDTNSIIPYVAQSFCKHSSTTACQCNPLPHTKIIFFSLSLMTFACKQTSANASFYFLSLFFCPALEGCLPPCCSLRWKEQVL